MNTKVKKRKNRAGKSLKVLWVFILFFVFPGFFILSPAHAINYDWVGDSGLWNEPNNWNPLGPPPVEFPTNAANLTNSNTTNKIVTLNNPIGIADVLLDSTGTGSMTLSIQDGTSGIINRLDINNGVVNQYGGSYIPVVASINSAGVYNLSGGEILGSHRFENAIVLKGTFNQTGGGVGGFVTVYPGATYNLSAGRVSTLHGGSFNGIFNQTGGSVGVDLAGGHSIGGTYNLSNGGLSDGGGRTSLSGTMNQSGGNWTGGFPGGGLSITAGGVYNLSGGSFASYGDSSRAVVNDGTINYSNGSFSLGGYKILLNNSIVNLSGSGTRVVDGSVINNGTWKTTNTTVVYTGTFTNNGAYISDPAKNYFNDLVINATGYLVGGTGDEFHFAGDFLNQSQNLLWNTDMADLFFGSGAHTFLNGEIGRTFNWDDLTLEYGAVLDLQGNATLHVKELHLFNFSQLIGTGRILYDELDITSVPEPSTMLLLGSGLVGLIGFRRKFKK